MTWRSLVPRLRGGTAQLPLLTLSDLQSDAPLTAAIRARCHTVALGGHTVLCRALGRYKLLVDSRDLGVAPHLMLDGVWQLGTVRFLARRLRPGQVAWEVGAHAGCLTLLMAEAVGPEGRVLGFEPTPRLAALALRNLALNGLEARAEVRRLAVTARPGGTMRLRTRLSDPRNGRLVDPAEEPPDAEEDDDLLEVAVATTRLDDVEPGRVDLVLVDTEGSEEAVWAGMGGVLDRNPDAVVLLRFGRAQCREPARLLAEIAGRFPLRELGEDGRAAPVEANDLLDRPEATMLVLARGAV
jgi:FkbM family methyltransferase